jgi:hypothetical protein
MHNCLARVEGMLWYFGWQGWMAVLGGLLIKY